MTDRKKIGLENKMIATNAEEFIMFVYNFMKNKYFFKFLCLDTVRKKNINI